MEQISFTESEIKSVADFVNLIYKKASFTFTSSEAMTYAQALNAMHSHVTKMESHIFELKKVIPAKKPGGKK